MAGEAQIKITSDSSQALGDIKRLDAALGDLGKATSAAAATFAKITAAAAAVGFAISQAIDSVSDLKDMSTALGVSAQNLKYLQQSAALAGVGADELNAALIRMNNNIGTALISKTGPAAQALKNLGINFDALKAQSPDKQFQTITAALAGMPDPATRSALAIDLLGKQGPRLIAAAAAMDDIRNRTEELGIALSDLDVEMIDKAGDKMDELKGIITAGVQKAVADLSPYIITMVDYIESGIKSIRENADTWILVGKAIAAVIGALITFRLYMIMTAIIQSILAAATAMVRMYEAIKLATTAMEVMNAVMGKNPIVKIVSAVLAIGTMFIATKAVGKAFEGLNADQKKVMDGIKDGMTAGKTATDATTKSINLQTEAQANAVKEFNKKLLSISQEAGYITANTAGLGREADITKVINEEKQKLLDKDVKMTAAQETKLRLALKNLQATKDEAAFKEYINKIDNDIAKTQIMLGNKNNIDRAYNLSLLEFETKEKRKATELEKQSLFIATAKKIQLDEELKIQDAITKSVLGRLGENAQIGPQAVDISAGMNRIDTAGQRGQLLNNFLKESTNIVQANIAMMEAIADERAKYEKLIVDRNLLAETGMLEVIQMEREKYADAETQLAKDTTAALLLIEQEYIQTGLQLSLDAIQRRMMAEKDLSNFVLKEKEKQTLQTIGEQERQAAIVANRIAFEKKDSAEQTQALIEQGANLFNALGAQNKKAFEIAKAFNIANAIMNTYLGATKAFAQGGIFGFISAAAIVAAGFAQVAQIRSQTYSGRALGGPVVGGQSYMVGEKGVETFRPSTAGTIIPNDQIGGGATNVTFNIVANDTRGFDQLLLERRPLITKIIRDAQLEQGRRQ